MKFSDEEKEQTIKLLKSPDLINRFMAHCHARYWGRDKELILIKLATITRHFERGVSIIVTGVSSVGKSELVSTVLNTICEGDKEDFTGISAKYLLYRTDPLDHKIITFYEIHGTDDAAHIIRTALTEGSLKYGTVISSQKEALKAEEKSISAIGVVFLSTSASGRIDWELSTRVITIELHHDEELTRQVMKKKAHLAQGSSNGSEPVQSKENQGSEANGSLAHQEDSARIWQIADHLIKPLGVIIPYGDKLADIFPVHEPRCNRDFVKVLTLIKASALLHQYQRNRDSEGRVIANEEDYRLLYSISGLITQSISQIPEHLIKFLQKAKDLSETAGRPPIREEIQHALNVSKATIKRHVQHTLKHELITVEGIGENQKITVLKIPNITSPLPSPEKVCFPCEPVSQNSEPIDTQGFALAHTQVSHDEPNEPDGFQKNLGGDCKAYPEIGQPPPSPPSSKS